MIEKAAASDADVAFLDLEDSVAPTQKIEARANIVRAFRELDWGRKPRAFRVNGLDTPYCYRDIIEIVEAVPEQVDLIVVPKVERTGDVDFVATLLTQIERRAERTAPIGLELQIESTRGLTNVEDIAAASPRIRAVTFGPGDFAASAGMPQETIGVPDAWDAVFPGFRWQYAMSRIQTAASAADVLSIDGPYADFHDQDGFRRSCRIARALGFDGKWCIHPSQIAIANEVFSATPAEITQATSVIEAYEAAQASGRGAVALDGRMIDAASIKMARRTLARGHPAPKEARSGGQRAESNRATGG